MPNPAWVPDELSQRLWGSKTAHNDSFARRPSFGQGSATSTPTMTPTQPGLEATSSMHVKMAGQVRRGSERCKMHEDAMKAMKPTNNVLPKNLY